MNTRFNSLYLSVAVVLLQACNISTDIQPEIQDNNNLSFEISVGRPRTKTDLDESLKLQWSDGDQIRLYHAAAGTDNYIADGLFTAVGYGEEVTFTGSLAAELTEEEYDWYAVYPAFDGADADIENTSVYIYSNRFVSDINQFSDLATATLSGKAFGVSKSSKPHISMSHLTTMVCVNVTNGLSYPVTIKDVAFYGTEDIAGFFFINMVNNSYSYEADNVSQLKCKIFSYTSIDPGESATVYFDMKPFTAPAGSELKLQVIAVNNGRQEKTVKVSRDVSFEAGKINRLNFTYTKEPSNSELITFADSNVESCCVDAFDLNYDNKLSREEAEEVTALPSSLFPSRNILSFNELQYFTSLEVISSKVFNNCNQLNSIILPEGLKRIEERAFFGTSALKSVNLPASVESIGNYAFSSSGLAGALVLPTKLSMLGPSAFQNTAITSVVINDGLKAIGDYAFYNCSKISSVSLNSGLTTIGTSSFHGCSSLEALVIPKGVETIGSSAFDSCTSLFNVEIPPSVKLINSYAFRNCSKMQELHLHIFLPPKSGTNPLDGNYSIYVPAGSLGIYQQDATWGAFGSRLKGEAYSGSGNGNNEGIGYDLW